MKTENSKLDFETRAIHSGFYPADHMGSTIVPIYQTASFAYDTGEELADIFDGKSFGYLYSRIANPTVTAFEQRIAALEEGAGAVAVSSGMAAISAIIFALTEQGDRIIANESLFGGTLLLFNNVLSKYGIDVQYLNLNDADTLNEKISKNTKLIFTETIGNPKLDVPNLLKLGETAKRLGIPLVIDSTLTTPYLLKAKDVGAALVVHSTTKYISGNGSTIGGIVVDTGIYDWSKHASSELKELSSQYGSENAFLYLLRRNIVQNTGSYCSPFNAFLQLLGVETLALRMQKHCSNALQLAEHLAGDSRIVSVNYPGLKSSPYHRTAKSQFGDRFGGLLTLRFGLKEKCFRFIDSLKLAKNLANLGDAKTLVIHPGSTIYHDCNDKEKTAAGVYDDMVRVSVGIESIKDIVDDFDRAIQGATQ